MCIRLSKQSIVSSTERWAKPCRMCNKFTVLLPNIRTSRKDEVDEKWKWNTQKIYINEDRNELRLSFWAMIVLAKYLCILYSRMHYTRYTHDCCCYLNIFVCYCDGHEAFHCIVLCWMFGECLRINIRVELLNFELHNDWSHMGLLIKCGTGKKTVTAHPEWWKTIHQVLHSLKSNLGKDIAKKAIKWICPIVECAFSRNDFEISSQQLSILELMWIKVL